MSNETEFQNLVDVLRHHAINRPNRHAYTVLSDGETDEIHLDFLELDQQARALAVRLASLAAPGDRVLLLYPTGLEYLTAFFGCLYAGIIPVPAFPPRLNRVDHRIQAILDNAEAAIALTTTEILSSLERRSRKIPALEKVHWISTQYPEPLDDIDRWIQPTLKSDSLAFIQYTSGSTASPKGVMVSHGNIIHNLSSIQNAFQINTGDNDIGVSWSPLYHDSGLILSALLAAYAGAPLVLMSPTAFAQRPARWLEAITRYKGTISGGPNFAFQWCVDRTTPEERAALDLSSWRVAFSGGEPIRLETIDRFIHTFAPYGFRPEAFTPLYGLAEATLMVTSKHQKKYYSSYFLQRSALEDGKVAEVDPENEQSREFVGCGEILPDQDVTIVNPETLARLPEDCIGEIWVSGPSVAQGYWRNIAETRGTFCAYLEELSDKSFLRTGDLGFIKNGELVITGRLKDVIIINGRNFYAEDIELTIRDISPALQPDSGAAFSIEIDGLEQLVIVYEVKREYRNTNVEEVSRAIRRAIAENHELAVYDIVLLKPFGMPRTSSNKIQRRACKAAYLSNNLERITPQAFEIEPIVDENARVENTSVKPRTPIEASLCFIWAEVLGIEQVGVNDNFFELGGTSLIATQIASRVEDFFHVEMPLSILFETPTVADLANRLEHGHFQKQMQEITPIARVDRSLPLPCSFAQERMWFIHQLNPESSAYNIPLAVRLLGTLNLDALEYSFKQILNRHEALRTTFITLENQPYQVIQPPDHTVFTDIIELVDLRHHPIDERAEMALKLAADAARKPFDLVSGPLFRVHLIRVEENQFILVINMHHIISDAWSINQLVREFLIFYNAFTSGLDVSLPELKIQYADYSAWQREYYSGDTLDDELAYWRHQLSQVPILELPADHPRPDVQTYRGAAEVMAINDDLLDHLKALSKKNEITLFMTLLATFAVLLHRYTGEADLAIGVPVANRNRLESEPIIGVLVNTLVMRLDLSENPTFNQLLQRVRQITLSAYDHQDLPFSKLISELRPVRDTRHTPITQILFNLIDVQTPPLLLNDLKVELLQIDRGGAQFDLTLSVTDIPTEKSILIEYNTDLFEKATITRMMGHFLQLLNAGIRDGDQPISNLSMLTDVERKQLLVEWNQTRHEFPMDLCLPDLVEAQVERTPDAIAVQYKNERLSYLELNRRANRLAHHLRQVGAKPGKLVGIYVNRSTDLLVSLLAVLKAGGAYVPLDPTFPVSRLAYMIEDANISLLLTRSDLEDELPPNDTRLVYIDKDWTGIPDECYENPIRLVKSSDLAYVIYTSGSTGKPKGVQITQRAVVNFLLSMLEKPGIQSTDTLLAVTTLSFDIAVLEFLLPLIVGARVVIAEQEIVYDGELLEQLIAEENVTMMQATPVTWELMLESGWQGAPGLKMLCGGEALKNNLARRLLSKGAELWNMYGPTETTIWSCVERICPENEIISIGKPIANTEAYILDKNYQPVPVGVPGMLYIGGLGLSPGYLNLPELTAKMFIAHPFKPLSEECIYQTGDLARYLPDGSIECLGRVDQQVKVRGFRIELGEIETALSAYPAVVKAVVALRSLKSEQKSLVAYYVSNSSEPLSGSDLRIFLKETLPDYMVPVSFVRIESVPLTPNGKVNYNQLPDPQILAENSYMAPRNSIERELLKIWQEILNITHIGIRSSFFDLGGHSLLAIRLLNRIEAVFGIKLPVATIFQLPTIEEMALVIKGKIDPPDWSIVIPIQKEGTQRPIFCVHGAGGGIIGYAALARALGPDQPFYGLQARGVENPEEPHDSIKEMATFYINKIQQIQPTGPYHLAGYSFGGIVAYEMACQLREVGYEVGLLAVFDTYAMSRKTAIKELWHPKNFVKFLMNVPGWIKDEFLLLFVRNSKTTFTPERKRLLDAHIKALRNYSFRKYDGKVSLFRVRTLSLLRSFDPEFGWGQLASDGVDNYIIPGSHFNMLEEPFVEKLASEIKKSLEFEQSRQHYPPIHQDMR